MSPAWTPARRESVSLAAKQSNTARSLRAWPLHKIETLRFLVEAGMHSFNAIGELMEITKDAAIGKAYRLGIAGPRTTGPKKRAPTTMLERLDAMHAEMDVVLARARPKPLVPRVVTDNAARPVERGRT